MDRVPKRITVGVRSANNYNWQTTVCEILNFGKKLFTLTQAFRVGQDAWAKKSFQLKGERKLLANRFGLMTSAVDLRATIEIGRELARAQFDFDCPTRNICRSAHTRARTDILKTSHSPAANYFWTQNSSFRSLLCESENPSFRINLFLIVTSIWLSADILNRDILVGQSNSNSKYFSPFNWSLHLLPFVFAHFF